MFLDAAGKPDPHKSRDSGLAVGVPGTVAGLALAEREIRLRQVHARRADRAGHRAGGERLPHRRPRRRFDALGRQAAGALAVLDRDLLQGWHAAQRGRPARPARSRQHAARHRRARAERLLHAAASRSRSPTRCNKAGGIMTARRSGALPAGGAQAGARHLSRLRHRLHAAAFLRRRLPDRDAQHPGGLRSRQARARRAGAARSDRGDEARLCRPRGVPGRSGFRANAARAACTSKKYAARWRAGIGEKATPAAQIRPGKPARQRRPQHHAFLRHRPRRQRGVEHLYAQLRLRPRPGGARHRRAAQQRARRFHRQAGHRRTPTGWSASTPTCRGRTSGRCPR